MATERFLEAGETVDYRGVVMVKIGKILYDVYLTNRRLVLYRQVFGKDQTVAIRKEELAGMDYTQKGLRKKHGVIVLRKKDGTDLRLDGDKNRPEQLDGLKKEMEWAMKRWTSV